MHNPRQGLDCTNYIFLTALYGVDRALERAQSGISWENITNLYIGPVFVFLEVHFRELSIFDDLRIKFCGTNQP